MSAEAINHGTYGGAQQCRKRTEGTCDDCKAARNAYIREYRAAHPGAYELERAKNVAMLRALWRLAAEHGDEFHTLYAEEFDRA